MALNFPAPPQATGTTWNDPCGNVWVAENVTDTEGNNVLKWTIRPPEFDFPDVDPDSIWARQADGTISPINAGDMLDMGSQNSDIDLTNFPEKN
jgi:hypothetical protein